MKKVVGICLAIMLLVACNSQEEETPVATVDTLSGKLTFSGSTTTQPLVSKLAENFLIIHPNVITDIAAGGSAVGIQAVHDGTTDIGMASRNLKPEEAQGISQYQIAIDVLAIVVHPENPVMNLTMAQVQDIYFGKVTNWKELGGNDQAIIPVQRETSSGSRGAFDELALEKKEATAPTLITAITAGDMAASVSKEVGTIGYVGFGNIDSTLKIISINDVLPNQESAKNGSYPLCRPLLLLTGPLSQPLADSFIEYVLSAEGTKIIQDSGWIPAK